VADRDGEDKLVVLAVMVEAAAILEAVAVLVATLLTGPAVAVLVDIPVEAVT
jgi:hypothetical protein